MPSKVWDQITYQFADLNGAAIEVWEWINNFIPYFLMGLITWSTLNKEFTMSTILHFFGCTADLGLYYDIWHPVSILMDCLVLATAQNDIKLPGAHITLPKG